MKWLRPSVRGIDSFTDTVGKVIRWLVLVIMSITVYDVIMRYFFNAPTIWAYELSGLLLGPFWLLAGGYVILHDGHVRLDVLFRRFSPRAQSIIDLVTHPLLFFYCIVVMIKGWDYFWFSFMRHEHTVTVWGPPIWPFKLIILIGVGLFLLQGVAKYIRDLYIGITGRALE